MPTWLNVLGAARVHPSALECANTTHVKWIHLCFYPLNEQAVLGPQAPRVFNISLLEHIAHHLIECTALFIREIKKWNSYCWSHLNSQFLQH